MCAGRMFVHMQADTWGGQQRASQGADSPVSYWELIVGSPKGQQHSYLLSQLSNPYFVIFNTQALRFFCQFYF